MRRGDGWYVDEDTGVAFAMRWRDTADDANHDTRDDDDKRLPVAIEVEASRPSFFAREAAIEAAAFSKSFHVDTAPSIDEVVEAHRRARLALPDAARSKHSMATDRLEGIWRWNRARRRFGEDASFLVPRVIAIDEGAGAASAIVWPDGASIAIPNVEVILLAATIEGRRAFTRVDVVSLHEALADAPLSPSSTTIAIDGEPATLGLHHHLVDEAASARLRAHARTHARTFEGRAIAWSDVVDES